MTRYWIKFLVLLLGFNSLGVNAQISLDSNLIAFYLLDGNTDDASSLAINGVGTSIALATGKNGTANTAFSFNGIDSKIDCGIGNRGVVDTITVSAWVKSTSTSLGFIVGKYDWSVDQGFHLYINNGNLALAGRNKGSAYITTMPGSVGNFIADGNWHFVMGEIAGNRWTVWVDCIQVNQVISAANNPNLVNSQSLTIGYYDEVNSPPTSFFDGSIDEVRVYNRVLSLNERTLICDINYIDAPKLSNDTLVCIDSTYTLTASPISGTVNWQSPLGTNVGTGNTLVTSSSQDQTFYVFSELNGVYSDTSMVNISVQNCSGFAAPIGPTDLTVCKDSVFFYYATADSGVIYWESPLGTVLDTGIFFSATFSQSATIYIYAVSNGFFSDTSLVDITIQDCSSFLAAPSISNDTTVCMDSVFTLTANVNGGVVYWIDSIGNILGNGLSYTTSVSQTTSFYCYIEYNVQISDTAEVVVTVMDCSAPDVSVVSFEDDIVWPNIFTPNGDGINDYFEVGIPYFSCLSGAIYNRWGTQVYYNNGMAISWDGRNETRGSEVPNGTYFYIISYCVDGETIVRKGTFTLLR